MKTAQQSVRESERRKIDAGGMRMPGGVLSSEAAAALADLLRTGFATNKTAAISKALIDASNNLARKSTNK